jgi:hypothetical protein
LRVLAVALLGAVALGADDQNTLLRHAGAGEAGQARFQAIGQGG